MTGQITTADEFIDEMISVLRRRGWHKGAYQNDDNGACCIYGAVDVVSREQRYQLGYHADMLALTEAENNAIRKFAMYILRTFGTSAVTYNDEIAASNEEVIATLTAAKEVSLDD